MKYCKNEGVKVKKIGEGYLFENGIGVNETSYFIYGNCENRTSKEIFEIFKKEYNLENENVTDVYKDVCDCLEQLCESELVIKK